MRKKSEKQIIFILMSLLCFLKGNSQDKEAVEYYLATDLTVVGKAVETPQPFHRIDTTRYTEIPPTVKQRLTRSAGIAISFTTNSKAVYAKWCNPVEDLSNMSAVMTPVAYRGLDLYAKENGQWQFVGVGLPENGESCSETKIIDNLNGTQREYLLYLPLYSGTSSLKIGIEKEAKITKGAQPFEKRILVYGSSIVHGASASRPGLAYPAMLSRKTGLNFLNFGMSGVARMEPEVAEMIADIPADAYILDCIPNSSPVQVTERTGNLVRTIRSKHKDVPIILVQSPFREKGHFDERLGKHVKDQNENAYAEFLKLKASGVENIHFIFSDVFLGHDHEGTIDGTHPNDLGFYRMVQDLAPKLMSILE